jgi:hypothetical protein
LENKCNTTSLLSSRPPPSPSPSHPSLPPLPPSFRRSLPSPSNSFPFFFFTPGPLRPEVDAGHSRLAFWQVIRDLRFCFVSAPTSGRTALPLLGRAFRLPTPGRPPLSYLPHHTHTTPPSPLTSSKRDAFSISLRRMVVCVPRETAEAREDCLGRTVPWRCLGLKNLRQTDFRNLDILQRLANYTYDLLAHYSTTPVFRPAGYAYSTLG